MSFSVWVSQHDRNRINEKARGAKGRAWKPPEDIAKNSLTATLTRLKAGYSQNPRWWSLFTCHDSPKFASFPQKRKIPVNRSLGLWEKKSLTSLADHLRAWRYRNSTERTGTVSAPGQRMIVTSWSETGQSLQLGLK